MMKGVALALAIALAPGTVPVAEQPYRAQGEGWSLTIEKGRIGYAADGQEPIAVEAPAPVDEEGILHYRAEGLDLSIVAVACTDQASGRRYSDSVYVTVGDKEYAGCGGAQLPADSLDGTSWYFAEIGGEATGLTGDVFKDDRYALDFGRDRFVGYSGCNRIGGRYRVAEGVMTIDEFGSTRNGCGEPHRRRELLAWRILNAPMRISRPSPDILQLTGEAGEIRLRRGGD
jgi:heat shock protein HslJ